MTIPLRDHVAVEKSDDGVYVSKRIPQRMGNAAPIAYGGYSIAVAIQAAYQAAAEGLHIYSVFGHYLRPANIQEKLVCRVTELRKTANFATYRVTVEQKRAPGNTQTCMELLADFHRDEPSLLSYSSPPTRTYRHWQQCPSWETTRKEWEQAGRLSSNQSKAMETLFGLSKDLYELRQCPEGVGAQNLNGLAKNVRTSQDGLSPTAKSSADWIRVKHPLQTESEQMAVLGFIMDGMLSFLPLTHNHMFLDDAAACASLDFALRIFSPDINMHQWNLREYIGHRAGHGRTYSESKLWDENGNLVANMTQQSILRVPPGAARL